MILIQVLGKIPNKLKPVHQIDSFKINWRNIKLYYSTL